MRSARDGGTPGADPDHDVVELIGRGDLGEAIHRLMQRHGAAVYRYCREALRDASLADDVHQQVFLAAFRDLPGFAGRATVRVWLFAIARHRVLDAVKKRRRARDRIGEIGEIGEIERIKAGEPADPRPSPAESIDDARLREALVESLGELGEDARTAVLLHYQQGFTFEEMADICREKAGTLQARVARALPRLRACIEARLPAEADEPRGHGRRAWSWRVGHAAPSLR